MVLADLLRDVRTSDGLRIHADVEPRVKQAPWRLSIRHDVHGLDGRAARLHAQARLTGVEHRRHTPLAIGALHEDHPVALAEAKEKARLELVRDDDRLRLAQHRRRDRRLGLRHKFTQDRLARLDAFHEFLTTLFRVGAGVGKNRRRAKRHGRKNGEQEFLHTERFQR